MLLRAVVAAVLLRTSFELGYHRDLTAKYVAGFSRDAQRLIINANLYVDVRTALKMVLRRKADPLFGMHFDDLFSRSEHQAKWQEIERLIADGAGSDDAGAARRLAVALGRAHHAAQDYYAHSNHCESLTLHDLADATFATTDADAEFESLREIPLFSGAYFRTAPQVESADGPLRLHHDTLNKDKPTVSGAYLYGSTLDREEMHYRALACAALESQRLVRLAEVGNSVPYTALATYRSSPYERVVEIAKQTFAVIAAVLTGHWR